MDAILVASIDHGATPPKCPGSRTVASTAQPKRNPSRPYYVINRLTAGAIEDCARN